MTEVGGFSVEPEMPNVTPSVTPNDIVASLSEVCGRDAVRLIEHDSDSLQTNQAQPVVLVTPCDEAEVVEIMRISNASEWKVRVIGAGTQLASGLPEDEVHIAMSMERLNKVVEFAPADLVVTVQPGVTLHSLQTVLASEGKMLPLDPWLLPQATIGGIAATAASGPRRALYGTVRDMAIGLRVVYPDGTVVRTGGKVVKNVAGYDMTKLFIGSAGTLGVMTELTFKLRPLPLHRETVLLSGNREQMSSVQKRLSGSVLIAARAEVMSTSISGTGSQKTGADWLLAVDCDENASSARYQRNELQSWADAEGTDFTVLSNEDADAWWERTKASVLDADVMLRVAGPPSQWERFARHVTAFAAEKGIDVKQTWGVTVGVGRVFINRTGQPSHSTDTQGPLPYANDTTGPRPQSHATDTQGPLPYANDTAGPQSHLDGTSEGEFKSQVAQLVLELRQMASELGGSAVVERSSIDIREAVDPFGAVGGAAVLFERIKRQIDPKGVLSPGSYAGGI